MSSEFVHNRPTHPGTSPAPPRSELPAQAEPARVDVVATRLRPFSFASGTETTMVYVDWKNTGTRPVRAVYASITAYREDGEVIYTEPNYAVYAVFNDRPGIAPGEAYRTPDGKGYVIPFKLVGPNAKVTVEITRAEQRGIPD